MTVYILGGGPAGMAVVDGLVDGGQQDFVLIERMASTGGLAQTVQWEGVGAHDLGPHKLFTQDAALMARVEALLPADAWLTRDKISRVYMNGHYLGYPPSPFALRAVFGNGPFLKMILDYGTARLRGLFGGAAPKTFEEDIVGRLGNALYEVLFKPVATKLWGDPRDLDVKLSRGRIQTPSLLEVLAQRLGLRRSSSFEALTFRYPRGGIQRIWDAIRDKAASRGRLALRHSVTGLDVNGDRIVAIRCRDLATDRDVRFEVNDGDFVVSTLPLGMLPTLMVDSVPARTQQLIDQVITLNDLLLVFLQVDTPQLFEDSWLFIPGSDTVSHRVSEQGSFDPEMNPKTSIVCCEIMSHAARPFAERSDNELVELARQDLATLGYGNARVLATRVIRLPKTYPVFRPGYEAALTEVLGQFDGLGNFRTLGRQGAFNYIGTLDAMDIGYGFARWLRDRQTSSWTEERDRTSHYPVLD